MNGENSIRDAAMRLVARARTLPEFERRKAFEEFGQRSAAHAEALQDAQDCYNVLGRLPERYFSLAEERQIRRQALIARVTEPQRLGTGAAVVMLVATLVFFGLREPVTDLPAEMVAENSATAVTHTSARQSKEIALADGSTLWLDWNSIAHVDMSDTERRVVLEKGRAGFAVSHDNERPFLVDSGALTTRVTGTEFIVDARQPSQASVSVVEGGVEVTANGDSVQLSLGQVVSWSENRLRVDERMDLAGQTEWRDGRLVLRNATLTDAFLMLEPYSSFEIDTSALSSMTDRISATYFVDRANDAVTGLIQSHNLHVDQRDRQLFLSPGRPARPNF
ncbi:MAG: FecR domain-containing protein [Pseudomonadota bacterium]